MFEKNKLTELLQIELPIIQAPMAGGATTAELVVAVSNAGGLGSVGAGYMTPDAIRSIIKEIRLNTTKPFAINLFIPEAHYATPAQKLQMQDIIKQVCPELDLGDNECHVPYAQTFDEQFNIILEEKIPVFSFAFGVLDKVYVTELKKNKTIIIGTATNLEEAKTLEDSGVDIIALQGIEAGGHRGGFLANTDNQIELMKLIPSVIKDIKIPVIAAGGIMCAQDILKTLELGAYAVQMGTIFLTANESGINSKYKELLLNQTTDNTVLTKSFSGKYARGIKNQFIERMLSFQNEILDYPIQNAATQNMRKQAAINGDTDFLSMWAGTGVHLCKAGSATEIIRSLVADINKILR